jgi:hypothetical protein
MTPVEVRWYDGYDAAGALRELVVAGGRADPGPLHHRCPACGSVEHGVPAFDVDGVWVSVGRADGLTVVALSTHGPVGVDVEPSGAGAAAWVRTEAVAKAHGTGITLEHDHDLPGLWIEDLRLPPGYAGAVAGLSRRPGVRAAPRRTATR